MTTGFNRAQRRLATRAIGTFVAAGMSVSPALATDIAVPGDAPDLAAAVALASPGDRILVRLPSLIAEVPFTDLGGKAITIVSEPAPGQLGTFQTGVDSLWRIPDGVAMVGSEVLLLGITRVDDGARVLFRSDRFAGAINNIGTFQPVFEAGVGSRVDFFADELYAAGRVVVEEDAELSFIPLQSGAGLLSMELGARLDLAAGSVLRAGDIDMREGTTIAAVGAEISAFRLDAERGLVTMEGGQLVLRELRTDGSQGGLVSLEGTNLIFLDDFGCCETRIEPGVVMREGTVESARTLRVRGRQGGGDLGPSPLLDAVEIVSPDAEFEGDSLYSGEILGSLLVSDDADLGILDSTRVYGFAQNQGTITVFAGELAFLGGLENNGSIVVIEGLGRGAAPRTVRVLGDLRVLPDRSLELGDGDRLIVRGDLEIRTDAASIGLAGASVEVLPATSDPSGFVGQYVEAVGADLGPNDRGFDPGRPDTAAIGELILRNGVDAFVADWVPNTEGPGALYVDTVRVDSGGTLRVVEGTVVYCRTLIADGTVETPERVVLVGSCEADLAAPFGIVDLADITAFVSGFTNQVPAGDLAQPYGVFDLNDISVFVSAFLAPCE